MKDLDMNIMKALADMVFKELKIEQNKDDLQKNFAFNSGVSALLEYIELYKKGVITIGDEQ